jgi:hypothetical protein
MARKGARSRPKDGRERRIGRSQSERRRRRMEGRTIGRDVKERERTMLLAGIIIVMIIVGLSAAVYMITVPDVPEEGAKVVIIDAVGTRPDPSVDKVTSVKVSIKNSGKAAFDMSDIVLHWSGPGVDPERPTKDSFGTGGVGLPSDGWDPGAGGFSVKKGTVAWAVIDLTAAGGIGDEMAPGQSFKVLFSGPGVDDADATFKAPADLGTGKFVAFTKQ